ncbi:MAG: NAD+ synthase [Spirochaetia bacterium]
MAKNNTLFALYQMRSEISCFQENVDRLAQKCHQAAQAGAQFLVAPALCLGGYPAMDLWLRKDFLMKEKEAVELLQSKIPANFYVIFGTIIDYIPHYHGQQHQSLAVVVLSSDGIEMVRGKAFLPAVGAFFEERYFSPVEPEAVVFEVNKIRIGILYHQEFSHALGDSNLFSQLANQGVDVMVMLAATPYAEGQIQERIQLIKKYCMGVVPVVYVNAVGGQEGLVFDGQSMLIDMQGRVFLAQAFEEELMYVKPCGDQDIAETQAMAGHELTRRAIICGVRDFVEKSGFDGVCLGLSGGIDSALVATLAVQALGAKNVVGILMPSRYSSEGSVKDAQDLAENLGIKTMQISLEKMHAQAIDVLGAHFSVQGLAEENLQARLRGLYLMTYSNACGKLLLTTGNKSELAVGYSTLYGDSCGVLSPIGDLWKTRVYELARYLNDQGELALIPEETLKKAPSAELRPDQKDQDSLPDYAILDHVLSLYIEKQCSPEDLIMTGHDRADIEKVLKLFHQAHFKRIQYAPILQVTGASFGAGCMWPWTRTKF